MRKRIEKPKCGPTSYSCGYACISLKYICRDRLSRLGDGLVQLYLMRDKADQSITTFDALLKADKRFAKFAEYVQSRRFTDAEFDSLSALIQSVLEKPNVDRTGNKMLTPEQAEQFFETNRFSKFKQAFEASTADRKAFDVQPLEQYIASEAIRSQISTEFVDVLWPILPENTKNKFKSAGDPRFGFWTGEFDEKGWPVQSNNPTEQRGKDTLLRYLQQKGISPYTGLFVHLADAEGEHIVPEGVLKKLGDQFGNFIWISARENKWKGIANPMLMEANYRKNIAADKSAYQAKFDKAQAKDAKAKSSEKAGIAQLNKLDELASPEERRQLAQGVSEALGPKAYRLLPKFGIYKTFDSPYTTAVVKAVEQGSTKTPRRRLNATVQEYVVPAYEDKYGKQNPVSLMMQILAIEPERAAELAELMKKRGGYTGEKARADLEAGLSTQDIEAKKQASEFEFGLELRRIAEAVLG